MDLVYTALLSVTASILGPDVCVSTRNGTMETSLNLFLLTIMDAGGGKSTVFTKVVKPMLTRFEEIHGHRLEIETYTHAGLQSHMNDGNGYALLTSDEGHRLLSQLRQKELKGKNFFY